MEDVHFGFRPIIVDFYQMKHQESCLLQEINTYNILTESYSVLSL